MARRSLAVLAAAVVLVMPVLEAQDPAHVAGPTFDVASIKPSPSLDMNGGLRASGSLLSATNVPMSFLLSFAYDNLRASQLIGGPEWFNADRYTVTARAAGTPVLAEMRTMTKALLIDRLNLVVHEESRPLPGYVLEVVRTGRLGSGLRRRNLDCAGRPLANAPSETPTPFRACQIPSEPPGRFTGGGITIESLVVVLSYAAGGFVVDRTGLAGQFDVDLEWASELAAAPGAGVDAPASIFTAVQDQLGLRLRPERIPTPVVVIDRVERPRPD